MITLNPYLQLMMRRNIRAGIGIYNTASIAAHYDRLYLLLHKLNIMSFNDWTNAYTSVREEFVSAKTWNP